MWPFKRKSRRRTRLSATVFYAVPVPGTPPRMHSLGFVKVFKTPSGVLRLTDLPKRSAHMALARGSNNTLSEYLGVTEIFTTSDMYMHVPLSGDNWEDRT